MVADMMHRDLTGEQISLLNELIESAIHLSINSVDVVIAKTSTDYYVGDFAVLVHKLMDAENLNVVFGLARMEDRVYMVGRSRIPEVHVADILSAFGGGGHPSAASAAVKGKTLYQVERKLLRLLKAKINPERLARHMMTFPVISVGPGATLADAGDLMTRYNINVVLVMENGRLLGHIARQVVEKAAFHGLKDLPVSVYMNTEIYTVTPDATLEQVQEYLVMAKQRILPVTDREQVVGVITRTDLLNVLMENPPLPKSPYDHSKEHVQVRKRNVSSLMKERLPRKIIELLKSLGRTADELGYNAYAVGGFIRDLFLRVPNLDIDIVIEGEGIRFALGYAERHPGIRVRQHDKFGTAVILFPDGFKVDVATARREYYEAPGAMPIVELSSIKLDLYRRDFSINTLAVRLNYRHFGVLIDFFGAQKDIKERNIRVLHNLSFVEDPTRVFRAIRFETRFNFKIAKLTANLIQNAVNINVFSRLAGQRIFGEIKLMLEEKRPALNIRGMDEFNLLGIIHPELKFTPQMDELFGSIGNVISWFELLFLDEPYCKWMLYFLGLGDQLSVVEMEALCRRLAVLKKDQSSLINMKKAVIEAMRVFNVRQRLSRGELYDLFHPMDTEALLFMMARTKNEIVKKSVSLYFTQLRSTRILTRGRDIKKMGYAPGPIYRHIMNELLMAKLNGIVQTAKDERAYIRAHYPLAKEIALEEHQAKTGLMAS